MVACGARQLARNSLNLRVAKQHAVRKAYDLLIDNKESLLKIIGKLSFIETSPSFDDQIFLNGSLTERSAERSARSPHPLRQPTGRSARAPSRLPFHRSN